jgi:hypothetical protein
MWKIKHALHLLWLLFVWLHLSFGMSCSFFLVDLCLFLSKSIKCIISMLCLDSLQYFSWCRFVIFVPCLELASSLLVNWNINLIIGYKISSSGHMFNICVLTIVFLYFIWLDFNQLSHIVMADLWTYNNL